METTGSYDFLRTKIYNALAVPVYTEATYTDSNVAFPLIVMSRSSTIGNQTMTSPGVYFDILRFDIKAKTIKKVEDIRDFLIALLDGYDSQIVLRGENDTFDMNYSIYSRSIEFGVIYKNL